MALRRVSPEAWESLFNKQEDSLFVPYMLVPPLAMAGKYAAGDGFEFELRLFGTGTLHYPACRDALSLLGKLGLGRERGQFVLLAAANVRITLETPLRLKHEGHLLGQAPQFPILWRRLHARIALAAGCSVLDADTRRALDTLADTVVSGPHMVRWQEWVRYSSRQQTKMKFGGLLGHLDYQGELTAFMPWMRLGTALGMGGKTTFGLGCYRLAEQRT